MSRIKKLTAILIAAIMAVLSTNVVSASTTMVSNIGGIPAGDYTYVRDKLREGINLIYSVDSFYDDDNILDQDYGLLTVNVLNPLTAMAYNSNNKNTQIFCLDALLALYEYMQCYDSIVASYYGYLVDHPAANTASNFTGFFDSDYYKQNMATVYNSYQELLTYKGTLQGFEGLLNYKMNKLDVMFGN